MCYQASVADIMTIATMYSLPFTTTEAQQLAAVLPLFSCCNCQPPSDSSTTKTVVGFQGSQGVWEGFVGSIIGAILGI
jgi:hypothetical protein